MPAKRKPPMPRGPMKSPRKSRPGKRGGYLEAMYVEWEDSSYRTGWREPMKGEGGPCSIRSIGVIAAVNKDSVVIATSDGGNGDYLQQVCIPRSAIRKMKRVRI